MYSEYKIKSEGCFYRTFIHKANGNTCHKSESAELSELSINAPER